MEVTSMFYSKGKAHTIQPRKAVSQSSFIKMFVLVCKITWVKKLTHQPVIEKSLLGHWSIFIIPLPFLASSRHVSNQLVNGIFLRVLYLIVIYSVNGITGCRIFRTGQCLQNVNDHKTTT